LSVSADTIVAIATPAGRGGLGVVRLSGPQALAIGQALTGVAALRPRHAHFAHFRDAEGAVLDEVVATAFPAPRSATAEDVVEITAHGSPVLLAALVAAAQARGARLAEPGEFTRRAFLNGRIDLTQAEAVRDLIDAHTLFQARTAARQMQGSVAAALRPLHRRYTELIARLEAGIDFADDDVTVAADGWISAEIAAVGAAVEPLLSSFQRGRTVREGVSVAIVGRPNVGKSSLFNRLLASERAIVTAEAGTTRDLVAEPMDWEGVPVRLVDTAGLRDPKGEAERLGIQKSWEAAADAHLVLAVFDRSQPLSGDDHALLRQVRDWPLVLVVANKCDLPAGAGPEATLPEAALPISARTGAGLAELRAAVRQMVAPDVSEGAEFITNARHAQHLAAAAAHLQHAGAAAQAGLPHEMLLVDLYDGLHELDAITGQTTVEDILGVIFSTFCIGK
jgi:tRNA modification GTPase